MNQENQTETKTMKYQQGDVLIRPVAAIPEEAVKQKNNVIMESDHPHQIGVGAVFLLEKTGERFIGAPEGTTVLHAGDHAAFELPAGFYRIDRVVEKGMFDDLIAPVVD